MIVFFFFTSLSSVFSFCVYLLRRDSRVTSLFVRMRCRFSLYLGGIEVCASLEGCGW